MFRFHFTGKKKEEVKFHILSRKIYFRIFQGNDDIEEKNYLNKLLKDFIAELKELDRALIILYLDEKSHKEIAEILGLTETNVATKISRIKKLLKQKFSQINKE